MPQHKSRFGRRFFASAVTLTPILGVVLLTDPVSAQTGTITTLASLGTQSDSGVSFDASGNLYGTTDSGGGNNDGSVFELMKSGGGYSSNPITVGSLDGTDGSHSRGPVIFDSQGDLFGTAINGGSNNTGTVYEIAAGTNAVTRLVNFDNSAGIDPFGNLSFDSSGNLYGTAIGGGPDGSGDVFEIAKTSGGYASTATVVASFNSTNGSSPMGGVVFDARGNMYGTTQDGGSGSAGTVFEIAAGSHTVNTLASFNGTNGQLPFYGVVVDAAGNVFGTTQYGGTDYTGSVFSGEGTVFEIAAGTTTLTTIGSFDGANGSHPMSSLTLDANGNLFGTTTAGGNGGFGNVFEIAAGTQTITSVADFFNGNGQLPFGNLVLDSAGNLYGATAAGGATNSGTVFEVSLATSSAAPEPGSLFVLLPGLLAASTMIRRRRGDITPS